VNRPDVFDHFERIIGARSAVGKFSGAAQRPSILDLREIA
jgi:hypothetical protein